MGSSFEFKFRCNLIFKTIIHLTVYCKIDNPFIKKKSIYIVTLQYDTPKMV